MLNDYFQQNSSAKSKSLRVERKIYIQQKMMLMWIGEMKVFCVATSLNGWGKFLSDLFVEGWKKYAEMIKRFKRGFTTKLVSFKCNLAVPRKSFTLNESSNFSEVFSFPPSWRFSQIRCQKHEIRRNDKGKKLEPNSLWKGRKLCALYY